MNSEEDNSDNNEEESDEDDEGVDDYPSDWEKVMDEKGDLEWMNTSSISPHIHLGSVPTSGGSMSAACHGTGRILSFPNWVQVNILGVSKPISNHGLSHLA
jgi:hypothetical protein